MVIVRTQLEAWLPLAEAHALAQTFFDDRVTYPDGDFYSRKRGINKDIPEEYHPLLLLADHLAAAAVRLSPDSLSGPDGALRLSDGSELTVQVTLSHERDGGHETRLTLRDTGTHTGECVATDHEIAVRLSRILDALREKERRYRKGTDVLLIVDKSIAWGDVIDPGLPIALEEAARQLPPSRYLATYVAYGSDIRRLR